MNNPYAGLQQQNHSENAFNGLMRGVAFGQGMKDRRDTRNALAMFGKDPQGSINALLPVNPEMAIKLQGAMLEKEKAESQVAFGKAAGGYYRAQSGLPPINPPSTSAPGQDLAQDQPPKMSDADAEFLRMVEIDPAAAMKIQSAARDNALERLKAIDGAYDLAIERLAAVGDDVGYQRVLGEVAARLDPLGIDIRQSVPANYPGPDGVRQLLQSAMTAKDQLAALHRVDRLDADIADDEADNARADRATDSLIDYRTGRLADAQKRTGIAARRGNGRRAAKPASRPTATNEKTGEKVEWDGKAWVTAK